MHSSIPREFESAAEMVLEAGQKVFTQGQKPERYVIVTEGCVKVFARSPEGREVVLYRVRAGEMCLLTTACLLGGTRYSADGVTEEHTVARLMPVPQFERSLSDSPTFRRFVFEGLSQRLAQVTERFEQLALENVGRRLLRYLIRHAASNGTVAATHEQIAMDIGTAREVVSRQLKSLEDQGIVKTGRGRIGIPDSNALVRHLENTS